ncbi:Translation initiation factor 5 (eIF-5) [Phaffia rhodozyma]|uniref:Translation initiation factor 5 (EIF-5) n=1 Tax=Phaffia rhodozyma TaxID=264483 RepID=A0A0F7SYM7_PHARH|nr:Translation initiation factor 5 (eIF-5) [Phaffia rhodozyma]
MASVNIRRDVDDKFYRYKMPVLQTKIEGRGNGIKTVIPNMSDVARALARPPSYPTKFFGIELGAQCKVDDKNDRYIVNGAHDVGRLRDILDVFIEKFILCGSCKNPETVYTITKSEDVIRDCKACGARTPVDLRHKLTSFIVKNPPPVEKKIKGLKSGAENSTAANAEAIQGKAVSVTPEGETVAAAEGDAEDGADGQANVEVDESDIPGYDRVNEDDDDWAEDMSPEAVAAREKELAKQLKGMSILGGQVDGPSGGGDDDDEEDEDSPYFQLKLWILESKKEGELDPKAVAKKAKELGIEKKYKAVLVVSEWAFGDDVLKEVPRFIKLLQTMVSSEKHQKALLGGLERLAGTHHPSLIPSVPKVLMLYYQADILDEDIAKNWGTHVSKKYTDKETSKRVRKAAGPFLTWLDEADESDEESE